MFVPPNLLLIVLIDQVCRRRDPTLRCVDHCGQCKRACSGTARLLAEICGSSCILWCVDGTCSVIESVREASTELELQDFGFALEFRLPYYALRRSRHRENVLQDTHGLRRTCEFISGLFGPDYREYLCEAQISVVLTGVDEWFWTAYCLAEAYFGS